MTWYVEAVASPDVIAAAPTDVRRAVRRFAAGIEGDAVPAPVRRRLGSIATIERLVRVDADTWATLHLDVAPLAGNPNQSRVAVWGCFWGGLASGPLTAPPAANRAACQALVDSVSAALGATLRTQLRAGLSGTELT